jgi:hypothetical protein
LAKFTPPPPPHLCYFESQVKYGQYTVNAFGMRTKSFPVSNSNETIIFHTTPDSVTPLAARPHKVSVMCQRVTCCINKVNINVVHYFVQLKPLLLTLFLMQQLLPGTKLFVMNKYYDEKF